MKKLSLIDKALLLKRTALFSSLDLDLLLPIADKMEELLFQPRERIFNENQPANSMYLVVSGSVNIESDNKAAATLKVGEFFGDESLFNGRPRQYSATASSSTLLLRLSRTNLVTIVSECPAVALSLLEAYAAPLTFRARE